MSKKDYLISWDGNKDKECEFVSHLLYNKNMHIDSFDEVIEGFGGSFAYTRYLIRERHERGRYQPYFKHTVYDIDDQLINTYKAMIDNQNNDICDDIDNKMDVLTDDKIPIDERKQRYNEIIKEKTPTAFLIKHLYYAIRPGYFPTAKKVNIPYERLRNFTKFSYVNFICCDFYSVLNKYKDNRKAFLYLDPPYFLTCNSTYLKGLTQQFFYLIDTLSEYQCTILLIINNHFLINSYLKSKNIEFSILNVKYGRVHKECTSIDTEEKSNRGSHIYILHTPPPLPTTTN